MATPARYGAYEVLDELARGGMGVVYRARDLRRGEEVALKVLLGGGLASPTRAARMRREGEALLRLSHPHVVRVREVGEEHGVPWLAMELVPRGETLERRLATRGAFPVRVAAEVALALARALEHCHAQGVVHRDLKPENVLLTPGGEPLLTDFGLALDLDPERSVLSGSGVVLGTPGYWSPEQAAGDRAQVGPLSDVYGLGATLWALLVGRAPFAAPGVGEVVAQTLHASAEPPSRHRGDVPPVLDAICLRCLAKRPEERFPSAEALAEALDLFLAAPVGSGRSRRRRLLRGLLLAGLVLAGVAALGALRLRALAAGRLATHAAEPSPAAPLQRGLELGSRREWPAAEAELGQALARLEALGEAAPRPLLAAALLERGRARVEQEDGRGAREDLERAVLLDARPAGEAQALLGRARYLAGDLEGAGQAVAEALRLDPGCPEAVAMRGALIANDGQLEEGLRELERALALDPDRAWALELRGNARELRGDAEGARRDFDRALALNPYLPSAWNDRGLWRANHGDPEGALEDYARAIALGREPARSLHNRGMLLLGRGDLDAAQRDLRAAVERDPHLGQSWYLLGRIAALREDVGGARAAYDRAVEEAPEQAEVWAERGLVRREQDDLAGARTDLQRALELQPRLAQAWAYLGLVEHRAGDLRAALAAYRRYLELEPQGKHAQALRGQAQRIEAALGE